MMLFIISFIVLLISSLILLSLFDMRSKVAAVIGWYILGFSLMMLVEEVAHFFNLLHHPWGILAIQVIFLAVIVGVWFARKRPKIGGILFQASIKSLWGTYSDAWKGRIENILLTAAVVPGYAYAFFLGWMIAPNTFDVITTHAVRVVFWLQHGNLSPWNATRYTQVSYPINSQLQMLWSGQFLSSDQLFFTVQWLGALVTIFCVFGMARLFKFSRSQSLFASLTYACFPLIWMQSSTAQNDLIAAAVFLPVVYFFFLGITQRQSSMLALSGIAMGLSLGTKQTLYFYLPGLALLAGQVWLKYRRAVTKYMLQWVAACLAGFAILGSFIYIQNFVYFNHPLAPPEALESSVGGTEPEIAFGNITYNSLRLLYQSVDNSGLSEKTSYYFTWAKDITLGTVLRLINPNLETTAFSAVDHQFNYRKPNDLAEDASWFGPVGGILLLPLGLYQLVQSARKKDPWRSGFVAIVILYWLLDAWLRPGWDAYQGRYFIPVAGLLAPFLADLVRSARGMRLLTGAVAIASALILGYTAIFNPGKSPIPQTDEGLYIGQKFLTMFTLDWIDEVTLQSRDTANMARLVDDNVPADAVIGWYGFYAPEYPVFGERFGRKIIPIYPFELIHDREWLAEQQLDYILLDWDRLVGPAPADYAAKESVYNWLLLVRK